MLEFRQYWEITVDTLILVAFYSLLLEDFNFDANNDPRFGMFLDLKFIFLNINLLKHYILKVELLWIGKSVGNHVIAGIREFEKRISHYHGFEIGEIPHLKNSDKIKPFEVKKREADLILSKLNADDFVVLLDENGRLLSSVAFAEFMQQKMLQSIKKVVFVIGGAYGFDELVYKRANFKLSLSPMTFSHQLIRVIFLEQLYRANTIIRKEPYHNA